MIVIKIDFLILHYAKCIYTKELIVPKETLKTSISELRDQLSTDSSVEGRSKEELQALANRIESMINGDGERWEEALIEGLEQQLIIYEENHPTLTRIIQNILSAISGMGV